MTNSEAYLWVDGSLEDTNTGISNGTDRTLPYEDGFDFVIGARSDGTSEPWIGDIYYYEVRDGKDGPVALRFSAQDLNNAVRP